MSAAQAVVRLAAADVDEVVDVLCEAFQDYPVMRFVLGSGDGEYAARLGRLVRLFVMARVLREETLIGVRAGAGLLAAALVSRPESAAPAEYLTLRDDTWRALGTATRQRYEAFAGACATFPFDRPHLHLNMIGTRRVARGEGQGRALLEHVHALSLRDPASEGVTLTTENEHNLSLYRHFGYEQVGRAEVAPELTTWGFFRADAPEG